MAVVFLKRSRRSKETALVLSNRGHGFRGHHAGVVAIAGSLDQKEQKEEDVGRQYCEENFFEAFALVVLKVAAEGGGGLKWISCCVQCLLSQPMRTTPFAKLAETRNYDLLSLPAPGAPAPLPPP